MLPGKYLVKSKFHALPRIVNSTLSVAIGVWLQVTVANDMSTSISSMRQKTHRTAECRLTSCAALARRRRMKLRSTPKIPRLLEALAIPGFN